MPPPTTSERTVVFLPKDAAAEAHRELLAMIDDADDDEADESDSTRGEVLP